MPWPGKLAKLLGHGLASWPNCQAMAGQSRPGLAIAGPLIGVVGAVGAGALATQNNKAGDVARASGDVVLSAGARAKKIDEKQLAEERNLIEKAGKVFNADENVTIAKGKICTNSLM